MKTMLLIIGIIGLFAIIILPPTYAVWAIKRYYRDGPENLFESNSLMFLSWVGWILFLVMFVAGQAAIISGH